MRQRWMRLSNSRKLWISTRRNYYQTEVLTFYVTEICRERRGERVLQKTGPDPFSLPGAGDRETGENHQGNWMPGDALAQPLRCILIVHVPERQRVEADNLVLRESQISLRAVGKLALQGKAVQRFLAAIESFDAMITPQLLDAERHLFGRRLLEHAGFGQQPLEPRQGPGRRIERCQKRLPARRVEPKMLTIGQSFLGAVERALQHELADRAPRSLRGGVQHPLRLRRQAQIEFLGSDDIGHDDFSWLTI